jgi:formylglycine-generating enzyme required for sulfatase activity
VLVAAQIALIGQPESACRRAQAFQEAELRNALESGAPPAAVTRLVAACGTAFSPDAEVERRLRAAGATSALLATVRTMSPPLEPAPGTRWTSPIDGVEMAAVPGGSFSMGSPESESGRESDELRHPQTVAGALWTDRAEVTYAEFRRFVAAVPAWQKGRPAPDVADVNYLSDWTGTGFPMELADHPVRWVSWHAARAYAAWAGKRLPTEAEWEYLARSGTDTPYWWGDAFDAKHVRTSATGDPRDRESRWGIRDFLGSVWEWTSSLKRPYPYIASDGREDPTGGPRIVRGGSMASAAQFVRAANRSEEPPELTSEFLGFRCVR